MVRLKIASAILLMFFGVNLFYSIGPQVQADLESILTEDHKRGSISTSFFCILLEPAAFQQCVAHVQCRYPICLWCLPRYCATRPSHRHHNASTGREEDKLLGTAHGDHMRALNASVPAKLGHLISPRCHLPVDVAANLWPDTVIFADMKLCLTTKAAHMMSMYYEANPNASTALEHLTGWEMYPFGTESDPRSDCARLESMFTGDFFDMLVTTATMTWMSLACFWLGTIPICLLCCGDPSTCHQPRRTVQPPADRTLSPWRCLSPDLACCVARAPARRLASDGVPM